MLPNRIEQAHRPFHGAFVHGNIEMSSSELRRRSFDRSSSHKNNALDSKFAASPPLPPRRQSIDNESFVITLRYTRVTMNGRILLQLLFGFIAMNTLDLLLYQPAIHPLLRMSSAGRCPCQNSQVPQYYWINGAFSLSILRLPLAIINLRWRLSLTLPTGGLWWLAETRLYNDGPRQQIDHRRPSLNWWRRSIILIIHRQLVKRFFYFHMRMVDLRGEREFSFKQSEMKVTGGLKLQ